MPFQAKNMVQYCFNVGPLSMSLVQHLSNIGSIYCWEWHQGIITHQWLWLWWGLSRYRCRWWAPGHIHLGLVGSRPSVQSYRSQVSVWCHLQMACHSLTTSSLASEILKGTAMRSQYMVAVCGRYWTRAVSCPTVWRRLGRKQGWADCTGTLTERGKQCEKHMQLTTSAK